MHYYNGYPNNFGQNPSEIARVNNMMSIEASRMVKLYNELGRKYFERTKENPDSEFENIFNEIKTCKNRITEYTATLNRLKGIKICVECGAQINMHAPFCSVCGAKQPQAPAPSNSQKFCTNCGTVIINNSAFCTTCGARVQQNNTTEAVSVTEPEITTAAEPVVVEEPVAIPTETIAPVIPIVVEETEELDPIQSNAPAETEVLFSAEPEAIEPFETAEHEKFEATAPLDTAQYEALETNAPTDTVQYEKAEQFAPDEPIAPIENEVATSSEPVIEQAEPIVAQPEAAANRCPNCGNVFTDGYVFCTNCGTKLSEASITTSDDTAEPEIAEAIEMVEPEVVAEPEIIEPTPKCCPKCNSVFENGAAFCTNCGTNLSVAPEQELQPTVEAEPIIEQPEPVANEPIGITCYSCGAQLEEELSFCTNCGANLANAPKTDAPTDKHCPVCQNVVADNSVFCTNCGTKL